MSQLLEVLFIVLFCGAGLGTIVLFDKATGKHIKLKPGEKRGWSSATD